VSPCSNGACSTGEPYYGTPASRFCGSKKLLPQTLLNSGCGLGWCQPSPYLTCSRYLPWMDKWTSTITARRCADRYLLKQQIQCRRLLSKHYKSGFRAAFSAIANGESGEVPPVPPPKYWNTHYRTEQGKQCVELYFDGYRSGSALAASELTTMKTIGASYDWSIQNPPAPGFPSEFSSSGSCGHGGACSIGQGCQLVGNYPPGGAGPVMAFPTAMPVEQPSVFAVGPQMSPPPMNYPPPASGIGPANTYPNSHRYGPIPEPGFGQQQNPYSSPNNSGQSGFAPERAPQPSQAYGNADSGLPNPPAKGFDSGRSLDLPSPALQNPAMSTPGYATPGSTIGAQPSPQNQFPQQNDGQPGISNQRRNGVLTPGFSGTPPGQVLPGRLGPPDEFKFEPPAFRPQPPQP